MRLIDADALCEECKGSIIKCVGTGCRVPTMQTIEAEPVKHGRWVDHCVRDWRCSECGEKLMKVRMIDGYCYDDKPNYCPNCGAKMDLED